MNYSVDTNIFLRFLVNDEPQKANRVRRFFEKARDGAYTLFVESFIIAETIYMFSSYFKLPKIEVCKKARSILSLPFLAIEERKELLEALSIYEKHGIDFIDALLFVRTKRKEAHIASFDSDFDKLVPNLRIEP